MNEQIHPNLFVFDRARTADGLLFVTGGDRCRYLGKSSREKPDWLKQNEGRYRRIDDFEREPRRLAPAVESETKVAAVPAGSNGQTSLRDVRKDGDDKDDVALADALLGDCSRPCEPTSLPTPAKENAEKQKPPTRISRSTPKLSPKLMRTILNALTEYPVLSDAADKAGIHRKTPEYWLKRSAAGDNGYDIKWQGLTQRFHEHYESAIWEAEIKLRDMMFERALLGYNKVLTRRGRVMYKMDQDLVSQGYQGPDAYLKDENGNPIPETIRKVDMKAMRFILEWYRPNTWGKHPKIDVLREGGVLVIGDVTKKPKYNTAASVRARKWKAGSRMLREEK
jgi:hypothetical protein